MKRSIQELKELRKALKLKTVHLFGHSWGAMLAAAYLASDNVQGVKSVTFASPSINTNKWDRGGYGLALTLSTPYREAIELSVATGKTDGPGYKAAFEEFLKNFFARKSPLSEDLLCTNEQFNNDINFYALGVERFQFFLLSGLFLAPSIQA